MKRPSLTFVSREQFASLSLHEKKNAYLQDLAHQFAFCTGARNASSIGMHSAAFGAITAVGFGLI